MDDRHHTQHARFRSSSQLHAIRDARMKWTFFPVAEFDRWAPAWDCLSNQAGGSVLQSADFVRPLLACFSSGDELLAVGSDASGVHAMVLVQRNSGAVWSSFQPSQAPLGLWVQDRTATLEAMAISLMQSLPGFTLLFAVQQIDPDLRARPTDGQQIGMLDYIRTARVTLSGTFEQYWAERGKNLRQNIKKQRNKLDKDGILTRLEAIVDPAQVPAAIADYGRLESAGWKAGTGTAVHQGNVQGRFYCALMETFLRRGEGVIYRYWYDDAVVAMDLCIEGNGSLIILKTTYDESICGTSPALLMRYDYFPALFEQKRLQRIEFYGKLMDWHTRWSTEVRTIYHCNIYRWGFLLKLHQWLKPRKKEISPSCIAVPTGQELP
jgi:CelD/BcsL family acetyltransferase involved in cellulose biosynthesis